MALPTIARCQGDSAKAQAARIAAHREVGQSGANLRLDSRKIGAIEQIAAVERVQNTLGYGLLKLHPYWDPLRGDPRFEKIVASVAPK